MPGQPGVKDAVVSGRQQVPRFQGCQGNNRSAVQMFFLPYRGAGRVLAFAGRAAGEG